MTRPTLLLFCISFVLMCLATTGSTQEELRPRRGALVFPGASTPITEDQSDVQASADAGSTRELRAVGDDEEEVEEYEDGPEGRHLKRKLKRKFRPHKYPGYGGLVNGLLGGYPGYGGGHHGLHGHQHHHHRPGGFGGGWQQPGFGGPIAIANAGAYPQQQQYPGFHRPQGYGGGWRPGYGGGYPGGYGPQRPSAQSQVASWNFGPFQASLGFAQAGRR